MSNSGQGMTGAGCIARISASNTACSERVGRVERRRNPTCTLSSADCGGGSGGFTLLEMLVAVAIFAILAMLAYGGLNSVLLTQSTVEQHAEALHRLQVVYRWLQRDIEQAVARPVRDELGGELPPLLAGSQYSSALELTRGGWRNPVGQPRSSLMRVAYRVEDDTLIRHQWQVLDRAPDSQTVDRDLIAGVVRLEIRWLDGDGDWQPQWPPANVNPQQVGTLPRAAEVILDTERWGELTWLFRLPE